MCSKVYCYRINYASAEVKQSIVSLICQTCGSGYFLIVFFYTVGLDSKGYIYYWDPAEKIREIVKFDRVGIELHFQKPNFRDLKALFIHKICFNIYTGP